MVNVLQKKCARGIILFREPTAGVPKEERDGTAARSRGNKGESDPGAARALSRPVGWPQGWKAELSRQGRAAAALRAREAAGDGRGEEQRARRPLGSRSCCAWG